MGGAKRREEKQENSEVPGRGRCADHGAHRRPTTGTHKRAGGRTVGVRPGVRQKRGRVPAARPAEPGRAGQGERDAAEAPRPNLWKGREGAARPLRGRQARLKKKGRGPEHGRGSPRGWKQKRIGSRRPEGGGERDRRAQNGEAWRTLQKESPWRQKGARGGSLLNDLNGLSQNGYGHTHTLFLEPKRHKSSPTSQTYGKQLRRLRNICLETFGIGHLDLMRSIWVRDRGALAPQLKANRSHMVIPQGPS